LFGNAGLNIPLRLHGLIIRLYLTVQEIHNSSDRGYSRPVAGKKYEGGCDLNAQCCALYLGAGVVGTQAVVRGVIVDRLIYKAR